MMKQTIKYRYSWLLLFFSFLFFSLFALPFNVSAQSVTYYVDNINGDDSKNGTSPLTPWKTLSKINSTTFQPGDNILFIANGIWTGTLSPKGSGSSEKQIIISKYGTGSLPLINGNGVYTNAVTLNNQEYWTVSNLEITNNSGSSDNFQRRGIYIVGTNFGTIHNIQLKNLIVRDVNSYLNSGSDSNKNYGGIYIEVTGSSVPTKYDNLLIDGCQIINCDRTGISTSSSWDTRTFTTNTNWTPSTNVIVRNCLIENSGGNGLIIRTAVKPLIERNVLRHCGSKISGNSLFTFNCDDALVQYNEISQTVYNAGDNDASGFDSDYRCNRSVFQYNYSHDNDDGFMVVTCQGGDTRFNDGTIVRYNISQNDGGNGSSSGAIVYLSGQTTNTTIHNNVIYSGISNSIKRVVYHNNWSAYPDRTSYYNNIFYILKSPSSIAFSLSSSTYNTFDYNLFYGISSTPFDPHKITLDPKFVQPGSAYEGIYSTGGYQLQPSSPCIDAGTLLQNHLVKDFWGNSVPGNGKVDIGVNEFNGTPTAINDNDKKFPTDFELFQNYPNPFNPETKISYSLPSAGYVSVVIYNSLGQAVQTIESEVQNAGLHQITWNGLDANNFTAVSGIYFCRLQFNENVRTIKMFLVK